MIKVISEVVGAPEVRDRVLALKPAILANTKTALDQWAEELASYIQRDKLSGNPVQARTGALRDSINPIAEQEGDLITADAGGGAGLDYARAIEFGSRPHEIVPRRANFLRFEVDGRIVYTKHVNHPGNRPFRYMRGGFEDMQPQGIEAIRAAVAEALTT